MANDHLPRYRSLAAKPGKRTITLKIFASNIFFKKDTLKEKT
jgi:hypothetical protein